MIREEIGGGRVQISGRMTTREANDVALLMRAGALAAPMEIVEERTVGPSLGKENIEKGFNSVLYGFIVIAAVHVRLLPADGRRSRSIALAVNLLLLVALLSMLQATLTLPGIAAIALTLGMAIDANVLINERIREELRWGATPHAAIQAGYERAWGTILDSNVTTLIAGIALLDLRLRAGPRLRRRALPRHPDVDVLGGVRVARHRQPDLRQPQEARQDLDRPGLAAGDTPACDASHSALRRPRNAYRQDAPWNSSRIQRDIPFMRHALAFNVISLVTFLLAVFFLATRGLNFGVDFRGGTVIEVELRARRSTSTACAAAIDKLQASASTRRRASAARDTALIRLPLKDGRVERRSSPSGSMARAQGRRPGGDAAARRVRRPAGRQGALRERRARAAARLARHRRLPRAALRVALRASRRSSPTCTTSIIILGFFAFFQWEFSLPVLAAVLAVLGYSVNESVVIADRIRENFRKMRKATVTHVIDNAITQHDVAHDHHPRLHADDGAVDPVLRRRDAALLRARAHDRHPASASTRRCWSWRRS